QDELTGERRKDGAHRRLEDNQAEDLDLVQPKRNACLDLTSWYRVHAAANDLDRIGTRIDAERDDGGGCRIQAYAREREREEDEINLDGERSVADHFDKRLDRLPCEGKARVAERDASDADHRREHHPRYREPHRPRAA